MTEYPRINSTRSIPTTRVQQEQQQETTRAFGWATGGFHNELVLAHHENYPIVTDNINSTDNQTAKVYEQPLIRALVKVRFGSGGAASYSGQSPPSDKNGSTTHTRVLS